MNTYVDKTKENESHAVPSKIIQKKNSLEDSFSFTDNRSEAIAQRKLQQIMHSALQGKQTIQSQVTTPIHNTSSIPEKKKEVQTETDPIQQKENKTGLPNNLKSGIEKISGYSMDDVKVHYNSEEPAQLQAHAFAKGTDIHLASGQERHLPHEAWHVVQQKQGRVSPTLQKKGKGIAINEDVSLEREANMIGKKLVNEKISEIPIQTKGQLNTSQNFGKDVVQLVSYTELPSSGQKQVDAKAEMLFAQKAEHFEIMAGKNMLGSQHAKTGVETMMANLSKIALAYSQHNFPTTLGGHQTPQEQVLEEEFDFPEGNVYYGAIRQTGQAILDILTNYSNQPLRTQLKLIYNACRNNNLAKWLKIASDEVYQSLLAARGGGGAPPPLGGGPPPPPPGGGPPPPPGGPLLVARRGIRTKQKGSDREAEFRIVTPGFAEEAGLKGLWEANPDLADEVHDISAKEKKRANIADRQIVESGGVEVHHSDDRSDVMKSSERLEPTKTSKRYDANEGIPIAEQQTIKDDDLTPHLTELELRQLWLNEKKDEANFATRDRAWDGEKKTKIPWIQGRESIDVMVNSEVEKQATRIHARLDAGISGSTDLMLHGAKNLGLDEAAKRALRVALVGWMIDNRDHSLYEILEATSFYGLPFVKEDPSDAAPEHPIPAFFYQAPENYQPFEVGPLQNILPENQYPGYFLTVKHKDEIADSGEGLLGAVALDTLPLPQALKDQIGGSEEDIAWLAELNDVVQKQNFIDISAPPPQPYDVRANQIKRRNVRKSLPFIYLSHNYPLHADLVLTTLIPAIGHGFDDKKVLGAKDQLPAVGTDSANQRTTLRGAGIPEHIVSDEIAFPEFLVERVIRLLAIIQAEDIRDDQAERDHNLGVLESIRKTTIWAEVAAFYGKSPIDTGGGANLILFYLTTYIAPNAKFRALVYEPQRADHREVLGNGVLPIAISNWGAYSPWGPLKDLIAAGVGIVTGHGNQDEKLSSLKGLETADAYKFVRMSMSGWMPAVIANIAKRNGFNLAIQGTTPATEKIRKDFALAGNLGDVYDAEKAKNSPQKTWEGGRLRDGKTLAEGHRGTVETMPEATIEEQDEKELLRASGLEIQHLFEQHPNEAMAIKAYSEIAGMAAGGWHKSLALRDFDSSKVGSDQLPKVAPQLSALVAGLSRLSVYRGGATWNGQHLSEKAKALAGPEKLKQISSEFSLGKLITKKGPFSSARTREDSFAVKENYDLVWKIIQIKTGRLIQMGSTNFGEKEVLFPPGANFVVIKLPVEDPVDSGKYVVEMMEV